MEQQNPIKRTRTGTVTSNKMDKTAVVVVERLIQHPVYRKFIRRSNKYKAHDSQNICQVGDLVLIEESRPLSKTKRWVIVKVLKKAVV